MFALRENVGLDLRRHQEEVVPLHPEDAAVWAGLFIVFYG